MTLSKQLPLDIFPTDEEEIEVLDFSIPCPSCGEKLESDKLEGTIEHDSIKYLKIDVKCDCVYCGAGVNGKYRLGAECGQIVIHEHRNNAWHKILLS